MYVPTVGCIAPAIHRSRLGPLLAYEGRLGEKVRALDGHLVPPLPAVTPYLRPLRRGATGPFLGRIGRDRPLLPSEMGPGCANPADLEVCI